MKVDLIQTSFSTGEIGASLLGRRDVTQYNNACETIENFLVRPYGSLITTPGTEFIYETKTLGARLLRFIFSRTDSYIIEFGAGYFRFFSSDGLIVSGGTTPYEVANTYTASELKEVQFCQLNDIIFLTHKNHSPKRLIRYASNNWVLEDFLFIGGPFTSDNANESIKITPSATSGTINLTVAPTNANIFVPSSSSTKGHVGSYWKINTAITDATTGLDVQGYVKITHVTSGYQATATVMKNLKATTETFIWAEGAWSDVNGYPAAVTFHNQRLILARTNKEIQGVWGSKPFVYDDFAVNTGNDGDALDIELASNQSNDIKWIETGRSLMAGTYGEAFIIKSGDNGILTPKTTTAFPEVGFGAEPIQPKRIGSFLYFVRRFGKKLMEALYSFENDIYKAVDKTIFAPHIAGSGFTEISYQQNPDTILWCVTADGDIATLTREVDQEVQGWSRQTTDGKYTSIATIPSKLEEHDEIWVIVEREIDGVTHEYIERFKSQIVPTRQEDCWIVHSGLKYNSYLETDGIDLSLSATAGTITLTATAPIFIAGNVGNRVRIIDEDYTVLGEAEIDVVSSSTVAIATTRLPFSVTSADGLEWGISVDEISGLDHLEAKTVAVLADGGVDKPNKVVSSGTIELEYDAFEIVVGLPYRQKIRTLPREEGSQRGTALGKVQRINELAIQVNRSYKGFTVGGSLDTLDKIAFRDPATPLGQVEPLFTGVIANIPFNGGYAVGAQAYIVNDDPLPVEILSIKYTVDTKDK